MPLPVRASVVLCTFNPNPARLNRVMDSLRAQTLDLKDWEVLVVDNASDPPVSKLGITLPDNAVVVEEPRPGLLFARVAGVAAARGEVIVFCDDDNLLSETYIEEASRLLFSDRTLGLVSGKSSPEFEEPPAAWTREYFGCLALYDHGPDTLRAEGYSRGYPKFISGGCGASFRAGAVKQAIDLIMAHNERITGRRGSDLTSGEDNDIVLTLIASGWAVAYSPDLSLQHLIPRSRLTRDYLGRLNEAIARSWVKVLHRHGASPWRPTPRFWLPAQIARAYLRNRAWKGPAEYVRWRGACGNFKGRADIAARQRWPAEGTA